MNLYFEPRFRAGPHRCVSTEPSPRACLWAATPAGKGIPPVPSTALCLEGVSLPPVLQLTYLSLSASNTTKPLLSLAGGGEEKVAWSNFELCSQEAFLLQMIKSTSYLRWIHLILPIHQVGSNVLNPRQKYITLLTSSCTSFKTLTYGQEDFPVCICVPLRSSKSTRAKLAAV